MTAKRNRDRKIKDAAEMVRNLLRKNPRLAKNVENELVNLRIAQQIYDLRREAGYTQQELAELIDTTRSVVSRLEDADYDGHSLSMLKRIASALGKELTIEFVDKDVSVSGGLGS